MTGGKWKEFFAIIAAIWIVFSAGAAEVLAAEIHTPSMDGVPGEDLQIPLLIHDGETLSALKAIIRYDPDILLFKAVKKTKYSSSFIHVVNDVYPGKLIVVMAAAEGIKQKNYPILELVFRVNEKLARETVTRLEISGAELVNEKLKNMDFTLHVSPIRIQKK